MMPEEERAYNYSDIFLGARPAFFPFFDGNGQLFKDFSATDQKDPVSGLIHLGDRCNF